MIEIKDGVVFKNGNQVGSVGPEGKFIPIDGLHHKTRESVERFLASEKGDIQGDAREDAPVQIETRPATPEEAKAAQDNPTEFQHNAVGITQGRDFSKLVEEANRNSSRPPDGIPDTAPEYNPYAGDKDPAYIEWYARNHTSEEFAAKYPAHRRIQR